MKKLVIFDLDGTLLNTIKDLAVSTNYALEMNHFPTHEAEAYNFFVGNGIYKQIERALPENDRTIENIEKVRLKFIEYYNKHNADFSVPYAGIQEMLERLQEKGVKLAVASNKYQAGTESLMAHFFPSIHFCAVLGQREGVATKPDPTIVHEIMEIAQVSKEDTLYIGDSHVDMQTAINSDVDACGVRWGFRPSTIEPFHPKFVANVPMDIVDFV